MGVNPGQKNYKFKAIILSYLDTRFPPQREKGVLKERERDQLMQKSVLTGVSKIPELRKTLVSVGSRLLLDAKQLNFKY